MSPDLIAGEAGASPQLAFWRNNFIAPPFDARDGFAPRASDPVFLALYPPPDVGAQIRSLAWDLRRRYGLRDHPVGRDRLHVSLHGICTYAEATPGMLMAIGAVCGGVLQPAFRVAFDRVESYLGRGKRALVLRGGEGVDGIRMLHAELGVALKGAGIAPTRRQIDPHVTLIYDPDEVTEPIPEIGWTVSEFKLVCSLRGRGRHVPLARWRLPDASHR